MELKELTNNKKREEWIDQYRNWPVWFTVKEADETYYRYDLPDGYSVVVKEYKQWFDPDSWFVQERRNGDSVVFNTVYYLLRPDYHFLADCKRSKTDIVDHLRHMGKSEK